MGSTEPQPRKNAADATDTPPLKQAKPWLGCRVGRVGPMWHCVRASGATRTSTVIATVLSRLATLRLARPRAQASLPPRRRTAVHRAAALGPVTSGLIASYERLGYG